MVRGELAEFIMVVVVVFFCIFPLMNDLFVDNNTWKRRKRDSTLNFDDINGLTMKFRTDLN